MATPQRANLIDRKTRMNLEPIHHGYRSPEERKQDFEECAFTFTAAQAIMEAGRCIQCPTPKCVEACPLHNDIPAALWEIEQGRFIAAANIYRATNPMPEICGRVCPDTSTCSEACVLAKRGKGIDTRGLETFVADFSRLNGGYPLAFSPPFFGKRVAVVGAGPAGMTVAEILSTRGVQVTVFDDMPVPGGLMTYGIPSFKLNKSIVDWKVNWLKDMGVVFVPNTRIGRDIKLELLAEVYDAVFVGTGAQVQATMDIPGEKLDRVHGALDFLIRSNLGESYLPEGVERKTSIGKRVAVIGGGDTATDCLRSAVRLGAEEVTCYYRRTEAEMPGSRVERNLGIEEGVKLEFLTAPVEIIDSNGDGAVNKMRMVRMELGEPDSSGRPRPVPIEGSEYELEIDDVVLAIGFWPDPLIGETTDSIKTHKWGLIVADPETGKTANPKIFAAGDNVVGPLLVNEAVVAARRASYAICDSFSLAAEPSAFAQTV